MTAPAVAADREATDGEPLLAVRDLVKHYPITSGILFRRQIGAVRAVDGVSFSVQAGRTLALVGESGCGKSTTARTILRLVEPTSGEIVFRGKDVARAGGCELRSLRR